jgi:hypothetical protein
MRDSIGRDGGDEPILVGIVELRAAVEYKFVAIGVGSVDEGCTERGITRPNGVN